MALAFGDYVAHDALGLAERVHNREISPAELAEAAIARLEQVNPSINAVASPLFDRARAKAAGEMSGRFAGVPFAIKDLNHAIAGVALTNGSRAFAGAIAGQTGELVERFEQAGLNVICTSTSCELGLTVTTESALYGATRNPWNLERSAGGSSGGAAALVAAGVLPAAHATDGGGSIRIPPAACGLFGMKPSRGRTPVGTGKTEGWSGLSTAHAVTRSVRDSAALLDAVRGAPFGARIAEPPYATSHATSFVAATERDPQSLVIAVQSQPFDGSIVAPQCLTALADAAALCVELGHRAEEARPSIPNLIDHVMTVIGAHVAATLDARAASRGRAVGDDEVENITAFFATRGRRATALDLLAAEAAFMEAAVEMARFHRRYDVLLTPVLGRPPAPLGTVSLDLPIDRYIAGMAGYTPFTVYQNITGQPAMSVPLHWSDEGLPIGVQFVAPLGREDVLFSLAAQLERARPWFHRRAPL